MTKLFSFKLLKAKPDQRKIYQVELWNPSSSSRSRSALSSRPESLLVLNKLIRGISVIVYLILTTTKERVSDLLRWDLLLKHNFSCSQIYFV